MLWRRCEFRGGNRVQRGKYPGFQTDSKEPFATKPSSCSHGSEMEPKKESGTGRPAVPQTRVAPRQERKIANDVSVGFGISAHDRLKTRMAVERISSRTTRCQLPEGRRLSVTM